MKVSCCCLRFFLLLGGSSGTAYDPSANSEIAMARLPIRSNIGKGVRGSLGPGRARGVVGSGPRRRIRGEGMKELAAEADSIGGRKGVRRDGPAILLGAGPELGMIAREEGKVVSLAICSSSSTSGRSGAATCCDAIGASSVIFVARLATAA